MSDLIRAAGGVVYTHGPAGELLILLIRDRYGIWTLPKGHLDPGEDDAQAAVREIAEETGVQVSLQGQIACVQYPVCKQGIWHDKQVTYFLASAPYGDTAPAADEGITAACWLHPEQVIERITYAQVREVVRQALARMQS